MKNGSSPAPVLNGRSPVSARQAATPAALPSDEALELELMALREENAELRAKLADLKDQGGDSWDERQREYEMLLDEKSEVIRDLHHKLAELEKELSDGGCGPRTPTSGSVDDRELEGIRRELEESRRQLEQDEESMMAQMRQMELALSRDRAELARQRQELTRLQADLQREIESAGTSAGLRERLNNLRVTSRPKSSSELRVPEPGGQQSAPSGEQSKSGFFRRMFGG